MTIIILDSESMLKSLDNLELNFPITFFITPLTESLLDVNSKQKLYLYKKNDQIKILPPNSQSGDNEYFNSLKEEYKQIMYLALDSNQAYPNADIRVTIQDIDINKLENLDNIDKLDLHTLLSKKILPPSRNFKIQQLKLEKEIQDPDSPYNSRYRKRFSFYVLTFTVYALIILLSIFSKKIVDNLNIVILFPLTISLGCLLFLFRQNYRLGYGIVELMVGATTILSVLYPLRFEFSQLETNLEINVKIGGGLYIIVRGLDNITYASKNTKFGRWLKKYFGIDNK